MAESDQRTRDSNQADEYDLFLSYSTDPDYALARNLEVFLRTFHRREVLSKRHRFARVRGVPGQLVSASPISWRSTGTDWRNAR